MRKNLALAVAATMVAVTGCGGDGGDDPGGETGGLDTGMASGTGGTTGGGATTGSTATGTGGTTTGGTATGAAQGLPPGSPCDATSTCADAFVLPGCCAPNGTCGGLIAGSCRAGMLCGGSLCSNDNPCCENNVCGQYAADGVTCEPVSTGGGDAGAVTGATTGAVTGLTAIPDGGFGLEDATIAVEDCSAIEPLLQSVAPGTKACCADDGQCGGEIAGGCLSGSLLGSIVQGVPSVPCDPDAAP